MKMLFVIAILLTSTGLMAQSTSFSGDKGNGGCPSCQDSYQLGLETVVKFYDIDFALIKRAVPKLDSVDTLYNIALNRKVVPGKKRDLNGRTLMSYVDTQTTKIVEKKYKLLSYYEKIEMEIHEMFVLAEIEIDGVYIWTTRIMALLPNYKRLSYHKYSCAGGECIIHNPVLEGRNSSTRNIGYATLRYGTDLNGVCAHLGLGEYLDVKYSTRTQSAYDHNDVKYYFAKVDKNGIVFDEVLSYCYSGCTRIKEITCKIR